MEKLTFPTDDGEAQDYYVLAETTVKGSQYLLVTEENEGDTDAFILKDVSTDASAEDAVYEPVEDEEEMHLAMEAFDKMLEDIDFE